MQIQPYFFGCLVTAWVLIILSQELPSHGLHTCVFVTTVAHASSLFQNQALRLFCYTHPEYCLTCAHRRSGSRCINVETIAVAGRQLLTYAGECKLAADVWVNAMLHCLVIHVAPMRGSLQLAHDPASATGCWYQKNHWPKLDPFSSHASEGIMPVYLKRCCCNLHCKRLSVAQISCQPDRSTRETL